MIESSLAVTVPRLATDRILLREYRMGDFDAFAAMLADPISMQYTGVKERRDAWRIFGCNTGGWVLQGVGWWAVELRSTSELVGTVGAFFREGWPDLELGWNTLRQHWSRGYATEAAKAVVGYAFETRREPRLTALFDAENAASLRVAARLGFAYESDTELFGEPVHRYGLAAPGR